MELSTFSYMLGIIELLMGIPLLLCPGSAGQWMLKLTKDEVLLRVLGALFLVISFLALRKDFTIGTDIAGLIRLVAWVAAIKSLISCWFPQWHARRAERLLSIPVLPRLLGLLAVGFGVLFLMAGAALQ